MSYQQNLSGRRLAIVVLSTTSWPRIHKHAQLVIDAIGAIGPGQFVVVTIPE